MITCEVFRKITNFHRQRFRFVLSDRSVKLSSVSREEFKDDDWIVVGTWYSAPEWNAISLADTMDKPEVSEDVISEALRLIRDQIKYEGT